jgi:peptidyl-prolyl cis-trans isomerase C
LKNQNLMIVTICLLIATFLLPACAVAEDPVISPEKTLSTEPAVNPDKVIAKVNSAEIKGADLKDAMNAVIAQNPQVGAMMSSGNQMEDFKKNILENLISTELLLQEGQKLKIKDLKQKIDDKSNELKSTFKTSEEFKSTLEKQNMTQEDLQKEIEKGIRIQSLIDEKVKKDISISADETKAFYDENTDKFMEKESVKASHILVRLEENADEDQKKAAEKKAQDLLKRVKKGEDFASLAKENSDDPSAAQNSGELGYFAHGQMVPEFDKAAFDLKVGEISDVVETSFGYHIIKCEDKKPERQVSYEESREKIAQYLENQTLQAKLSEYIASLKQAAKVKVFLP